MTIVVYSAAATEPITVAEALAYCRIDTSNQEPAPGAITVALGSGAGNINNGAHRYLATFVTADGETNAGDVSSAVTVVDSAVNGKVALSGIPLGGSLVTARKIYRTAADGSTYMLLATISDNTTTTYADNIADSSLGAGAPTSNTTSDPLMGAFIAATRAQAEQELGRYLVTQTLDAYVDEFPAEFMLPPLQSVTAITYIDTDGATQTLAADQYLVDAVSKPSRIEPAYGVYWPSTRQQKNAVKVRFVAGYGAASAVPQCIKNWMLLRASTLWENRSQLVVGSYGPVQLPPSFVDSLLDPERVRGYL